MVVVTVGGIRVEIAERAGRGLVITVGTALAPTPEVEVILLGTEAVPAAAAEPAEKEEPEAPQAGPAAAAAEPVLPEFLREFLPVFAGRIHPPNPSATTRLLRAYRAGQSAHEVSHGLRAVVENTPAAPGIPPNRYYAIIFSSLVPGPYPIICTTAQKYYARVQVGGHFVADSLSHAWASDAECRAYFIGGLGLGHGEIIIE